MNHTGLTEYELLRQWNTRLRVVLLPHSILLVVYFIVCVLGNMAVIYIYQIRFHHNTDGRFFMPYLAGMDMLACFVGCATSLLINFNPVLYPSNVLCKVSYALCYFFSTSSALMLSVIAAQRFLKICRPFKFQMSGRRKGFGIVIIIVVSSGMSVPAFVTFGISSIRNTSMNITGQYCASINVNGSNMTSLVYNCTVSAICVINMCFLCTLYTRIGNKLREMRQRRLQRIATREKWSDADVFTSETEKNSVNTLDKQRRHTSKNVTEMGNQVTLMYFIITFAFSVFFIPTFVTILWDIIDVNPWLTKGDAYVVGFRFSYTVFIINYLINPLVYSLFDSDFRGELQKLIPRFCRNV
ncbi:orexin/Hypocretin receptor type 1-like [Ylistrum balloti]|uniref:orexin/Hypocretin receptor type 1-like n=1 Tax=Ylistrum balloti TaxID=509963 RepID=UPI002905DA0D|nr:orexin/Hypocretin receptor type 1-like [Ylistrum balloti]